MADKFEYPDFVPTASRIYEEELRADTRWALNEGGLHFECESQVFRCMRKVAGRLDELGISYAVVGSMAMFRYGYLRFTEDLDLLVTPDGLRDIHERLVGDGYVPIARRSRNIRDAEFGVRIEFCLTGELPGDRKPKPIAFPDPIEASNLVDGVRFVNQPTLIELKLAAGMGDLCRMRDLADVQDFIKHAYLPVYLADSLHPYVRDKYVELWGYAQSDRLTHDLAKFPE